MIIITVPHCFRDSRDTRHCDERAEFAADALFRQIMLQNRDVWMQKSDKLRTVENDYNRLRTRDTRWRARVARMASLWSNSPLVHIDVHSFITLINPENPIHDFNYHKIAFVGIGAESPFIAHVRAEMQKKCPNLRDIYIDGNAVSGESVNDIIRHTREIVPNSHVIMVEVNENRSILPDGELTAIMNALACTITANGSH